MLIWPFCTFLSFGVVPVYAAKNLSIFLLVILNVQEMNMKVKNVALQFGQAPIEYLQNITRLFNRKWDTIHWTTELNWLRITNKCWNNPKINMTNIKYDYYYSHLSLKIGPFLPVIFLSFVIEGRLTDEWYLVKIFCFHKLL